MIRSGFLSKAERLELRALARDGLSEVRAARRANAIILLDKGWSCQEMAEALLIDDDTARSWHRLYDEHGLRLCRKFLQALKRLACGHDYAASAANCWKAVTPFAAN